jgi:hypothetical protein
MAWGIMECSWVKGENYKQSYNVWCLPKFAITCSTTSPKWWSDSAFTGKGSFIPSTLGRPPKFRSLPSIPPPPPPCACPTSRRCRIGGVWVVSHPLESNMDKILSKNSSLKYLIQSLLHKITTFLRNQVHKIEKKHSCDCGTLKYWKWMLNIYLIL